jgi:hypothetical protein
MLDHEQQRFALSIRPFHRQRYIEFAKTIAQSFFQLLLTDRYDARPARQPVAFAGGEKRQRGIR